MNIQKLSVSERIILAEKLWDSVLENESEIQITPNQEAELDKRLLAYSQDKNVGSPWQEVKNRIISTK